MRFPYIQSVLVAAFGASILGGCSLMGLSDGLDKQASCNAKADCASLEEISPTGDCEEWACNRTTNLCEVLADDGDDDGYPSAECAKNGDLEDCDDTDDARYPKNDELCDGVDNDCDSSVDEELLVAGGPMRVVALSEDAATHVSMAVISGEDTVAISYTDGNTHTGAPKVAFPSAATVATAKTFGYAATEDAIDVQAVRDIAITPLGNDFATAVVPDAPCQRVVTGLVTSANANAPVDNTFFFAGVPKATGVCDGDTDAVSDPNLSAEGNNVLVTWVARNDAFNATVDWECSSTPEANVYANLVVKASGRLESTGNQAVLLGTSTSPTPPAVLAIEDFGWLVAFDNGAGEGVSVFEIIEDNGVLEVNAEPVLEIMEEGRVSDVKLVAGEVTENQVSVGLAFKGGCLTSATIHAATFTIKRNNGAIGDVVDTRVFDLEGVRPERPSLAWQGTPEGYGSDMGWLVAWEEVNTKTRVRTLRAARMQDDDNQVFTVFSGDKVGSGLPVGAGQGLVLVPQSDGKSFGIVSPMTVEGNTGFFGSVITCDDGGGAEE